MRIRSIRAILAVAVVGVFMGITATMALFPLFSSKQVPLTDYSDFFAKTSSVYTGIVGVIIGYYFGRSTDASTSTTGADARPADSTTPTPSPPLPSSATSESSPSS